MQPRLRILIVGLALGALILPLGSASSGPGPLAAGTEGLAVAAGPCEEACNDELHDCTNGCAAGDQACYNRCELLGNICMLKCRIHAPDEETGIAPACLRLATGAVELSLA